MLDDVTGSIMFPDSFTPVPCAQCEPSLICEKNRAQTCSLVEMLSIELSVARMNGAGQRVLEARKEAIEVARNLI